MSAASESSEPAPSRPLCVLVGTPGSGKTTVGLLLADALGTTFRDTDADVEEAAGVSVSDIFVVEGEPAFRAREHDAVARALAEHTGVLALGGGAVMDQDTRALLRGHRVVFLDVGLPEAAKRVGLTRDRPLLIGNPRAELRRLMGERRPLYEEVAAVTVATDGRSPDEIAREVADWAREAMP